MKFIIIAALFLFIGSLSFISAMLTEFKRRESLGCQKTLKLLEYDNALGYDEICNFIVKGVD